MKLREILKCHLCQYKVLYYRWFIIYQDLYLPINMMMMMTLSGLPFLLRYLISDHRSNVTQYKKGQIFRDDLVQLPHFVVEELMICCKDAE